MPIVNAVDYRKKPRFAVDLSFDGGEGFDDEPLMEYVASVNIACGGHTGDERSMRKATRIALRRFVAINAHPAYPDPENFGRASMQISPEEIELSVAAQVEALRNIVRQEEGEVTGVKPHGALYHDSARDLRIAQAVARGVFAVSPRFVLITAPGSKMIEAGAELDMVVAIEGFADRAYRPDGRLVSRDEPGALVTSPAEAVHQALTIVREKRVKTTDGSYIEIAADTLCLHGDTPGARDIGRAVRSALLNAEVVVRPLRGWRPRVDPGPPPMPIPSR